MEEAPVTDTILEEESVSYEIVEKGSKRGGLKLVSSDGYSFTLKMGRTKKAKESGEGSKARQWRCRKRLPEPCLATVNQKNSVFSKGKHDHNHAPDLNIGKKVKVQTVVKMKATKDVHKSSADIVDEGMEQEFGNGDFNLPNTGYLQRIANRARSSIRPKEPETKDFKINTDFLDSAFIIGDVQVGTERHILFATDDQLHLLQRARRWYLDGTFKIVCKPFIQLFDFETGLWAALRDVFPGTNMKGCTFHWCQAVFRKVSNLGLRATYEKREGVHWFIARLLSLPFLPAEHIEQTFETMKSRAPNPKLIELWEYIENQWIHNSSWNVREWSCFRQNVWTNNDCEGWHRRINGKAGRAKLQFYVLVPLLQREALLVKRQAQLVLESNHNRHTRTLYTRLDKLTET